MRLRPIWRGIERFVPTPMGAFTRMTKATAAELAHATCFGGTETVVQQWFLATSAGGRRLLIGGAHGQRSARPDVLDESARDG